MFKSLDLERTVKLLSDNKFYEIKSEIKRLNFFKKIPKQKINTTIGFINSNQYRVNIDIENNLIVLTDKFNADRTITLVELTHSGTKSTTLYNSLIKSMNPELVLIEQEPYINNIDNIYTKIDIFDNLNNYKEFLLSTKLQYEISSNVVMDKYKMVLEVESIILNALQSSVALGSVKKQVRLYDVPNHNFFKSFLHFYKESSKDDLNMIKQRIQCLNIMEIYNWLKFQEAVGCRNCASFLNKAEVSWYPLSLEFLINKNTLPNADYINQYKQNRINQSLEENKNNVIIFAQDIIKICEQILNKENNKENILEFDDYINNTDLKTDLEKEKLSLALHLKENYKSYYTNLPFKVNKDVANLEHFFKKDYEFFNKLDNFGDLIDEINNTNSSEETLTKNEKNFINRKNNLKTMNTKGCEPFNYLKQLQC
jgi:hypothetical protein